MSETIELETTHCSICQSQESKPWLSNLKDRWFPNPHTYQIVECKNCGHTYLNPRPAPQSLHLCYPEKYQPYHGSQNSLVAWIKKKKLQSEVSDCKKHVPPPGKVLEIGTARGDFLKLLQEAGYQTTGIEFNEQCATFAKQSGLNVHGGTLESTNFPHQEFDFVYMKYVIEHLPDVNQTLAELARITKPGGWLMVATCDFDCTLVSTFKENTFDLEIPRHLNFYSSKSLETQLKKHGFTTRSISHDPAPNSWVHSCALKWEKKNWIRKFFTLENPLALLLFSPLSFYLAAVKRSSRIRVWAQKS